MLKGIKRTFIIQEMQELIWIVLLFSLDWIVLLFSSLQPTWLLWVPEGIRALSLLFYEIFIKETCEFKHSWNWNFLPLHFSFSLSFQLFISETWKSPLIVSLFLPSLLNSTSILRIPVYHLFLGWLPQSPNSSPFYSPHNRKSIVLKL